MAGCINGLSCNNADCLHVCRQHMLTARASADYTVMSSHIETKFNDAEGKQTLVTAH